MQQEAAQSDASKNEWWILYNLYFMTKWHGNIIGSVDLRSAQDNLKIDLICLMKSHFMLFLTKTITLFIASHDANL